MKAQQAVLHAQDRSDYAATGGAWRSLCFNAFANEIFTTAQFAFPSRYPAANGDRRTSKRKLDRSRFIAP